MDTVSMLNTMSFYCQPILPLVYDESMSYYETLCKVVGQLNTTGETVNKLNEGLTNEISDRQKADSLLNERLKVVEATNKKIHFMAFAGTPPHNAKPIGTMPTRSELRQWVNDGDMIVTLMETTDEGRNVVYAASCAYNAGNWGNESSDDFNIIVPINTSYDATGDYAVRQKVAKITIPPASASSLDEEWGLQFIEINTPSTAANGVVNFAANISESGSLECSLTPYEFAQLYAPAWANKNLCVAVNAKLFYDGYTRTSSIATINSTNHLIRIAFERDNGVFAENGVRQLNKNLDYIVGNVSTNTWSHETIDTRIQDFPRYEGFQFTRGAGNVITADVDSTPNAVYAHYTADTSGKLFQNLPVRLIDTVDNAEYWNGTFDIYNGKHMTFTFVTSNYATASDKMLVRVIELSADTNTNTWKYGVKEFEVPYRPTAYVLDVWQTNDTPSIVNGYVSYDSGSNLDFDDLLPLVEGNQEFVATLHKGDSDKGIEWSGLVYSSNLINNGIGRIVFATTEGVTLNNGIPSMHGIVVFTKDSTGVKKVVTTFSSALPAPSSDGADNGKVPTINGTTWELKAPTVSGVDTVMSDTSTNAVQNKVIKKYVDDHAATDAVLYTAQTLTFEQKQQARNNIEAVPEVGAATGGTVSLCPDTNDIDSNNSVHVTPTKVGGDDFTLTLDGGPEEALVRVKGIRTPTDADTSAAANVEYVKAKVAGAGGSSDFIITATVDDNNNCTLDKTFAQIQEAIQSGKRVLAEVSDFLNTRMPLVLYSSGAVFFGAVAITTGNIEAYTLAATANEAKVVSVAAVTYTSDSTMPQVSMAADPSGPKEIATKQYVDAHAGGGSSSSTKVTLNGNIEGDVEGYTSTTYQQITNEIANNCNIWLAISGETFRLASYKQSGASAYTLVFFGAGDGALTVKYEVTASASSASLSVTGS